MQPSDMLVTAVESTTLASVSYDATAQRLWLQFRSCAVYCYFGVSPVLYQALLTASSKGRYFNRNIRGRFPYHKEPDCSRSWSPCEPKRQTT